MAGGKKEILCTLGPASLNERVIKRLTEIGATLFRINLSHTKLRDVAQTIDLIRSHTTVPICLDTHGAQVRTGDLVGGDIEIRENTIIRVHHQRVPGDSRNFNFYPLDIVKDLVIGDIISIDFNSVLAQVVGRDGSAALMRVLNGGQIGQNKAVTIDRDIPMPALTEDDEAALRIGADMGLSHFALSFANRGADVDKIRAIVGPRSFVISKIESRSGLENFEHIARKSDAILLDRGDLSRELPIQQIPRVQKEISQTAKSFGAKVYVATNLLESMVSAPTPTRAEVNDVFNTLADGADGLVLAAETAIGDYPIQCANMIVKMIREFEQLGSGANAPRASLDTSLLVEPHGGRLVQQGIDVDQVDEMSRLRRLQLTESDLLDCEQFALGTYSPLQGFMDRETLASVLHHHRLPSGEAWTMPIVLQANAEFAKSVGKGDRIALTDTGGDPYALLTISDIYSVDLESLSQDWFGTTSGEHPGVKRLRCGGSWLLAGDVTLVRRLPREHHPYQLTPAQTRFVFTHKGWSKVVGFHTRNPIHRVHEFVQMKALERTGADGLLISPIIGPKKSQDFLPDPIIKSYQLMLEFGLYPKGKVVLSTFSTYSRYCGPREAVFTALCRKNMGCSHFIVGRDHTGVGEFYCPEANWELFERLGDIGIEPIFFDEIGYDPVTQHYTNDRTNGELMRISGTKVRETLRAGESLPDWFMRDLVQEMLRQEISAGRQLFFQ